MTGSRSVRRALGRGALLLTVVAVSACAAAVELAPLEARWERYMLEGVRGIRRPGAEDLRPCSQDENPRGAVLLAVGSKQCIAVLDLTETGFFGLGTGGGWGLQGGRLSQVETEKGNVELYVKIVWRYEPGIFDNHIDLDESKVEFFLTFHDPTDDERSILRKWTRRPGRSLRGVTGQLVRRPDTQEIDVRVAGLPNAIHESFSLDALKGS